jgi:hypothetical protein
MADVDDWRLTATASLRSQLACDLPLLKHESQQLAASLVSTDHLVALSLSPLQNARAAQYLWCGSATPVDQDRALAMVEAYDAP